ncbi:MAG: RIO1 family regulatory kinase/ATPase [Chloroflexota bacterium]
MMTADRSEHWLPMLETGEPRLINSGIQMDKYDELEKYADYEEYFEAKDRKRQKKQSANKKSGQETGREELSDFSDDIADFVPSYAVSLDPQHHERQWVIDSISSFYRDNLITDVTRRVKAGKEANVYCCTAHPATEIELIAAKLYRPRMLRTLKNDADYKAGRMLRGEDGKQMKGRREKLAIHKKTKFGKKLDTVWWIGNEFKIQSKLFDAGADVPAVVAHNGNTILMEYVGDEQLPAPTLSDIRLDKESAHTLFDQIMRNVSLMLDLGFVHGDLSAYNILYWNETIRIIDFPQVVEIAKNPNAYRFFMRDVRRVCSYFGRLGVKCDADAVGREIWENAPGTSGLMD